MKQAIQSQLEFDRKIKGSKGGALLLFHSTQSPPSEISNYAEQAEDKCGIQFSVYTMNVDELILSKEDVQKYQEGKYVICCCVLFDDKVLYKKVNPDPAELWNQIQCS